MRLNPAGGATVDVTDRAGRLLGQVSAAAGATWDVSDRAARLVGLTAERVIASGANGQSLATPAANTVIADTGALAAGTWRFYVAWCSSGAIGPQSLQVQYRDAANAANLAVLGGGSNITPGFIVAIIVVLVNERVRVLGGNGAADIVAGITWERLN